MEEDEVFQRLVQELFEARDAGRLTDEVIEDLRGRIGGISSEVRKSAKSILATERSDSPWLKYGVTEKFYNHLKPKEWSLFEIFAQNQHRRITVDEAVELLGLEPTDQNLGETRRAASRILIAAKNDKVGTLQAGNANYRGKSMRVAYQWRPAPPPT